MFLSQSTRALVRSLLRIAGPVALARLGVMGMGVTDTIVVGQLAPASLAYLALGWAPTGVLIVTGMGLLMGVQVLAARVIGEGRAEAAGAVWRKGLVVGVAAGGTAAVALFALAEPMFLLIGIEPELSRHAAEVSRVLALGLPLHFAYVACSYFLEAVRRPIVSTGVIWIANLLNLVVNLMLVPDLGAVGSAWATVAARVFMVVVLVGYVAFGALGRQYGVRSFDVAAPGYRMLYGVGLAAGVSQAAEVGAFSAMTMIAGRIGQDAVAAYQILLNVLAVVFMIALGLAAATSVAVAQAWGGRDEESARHAAWTGLSLNTIAMLASSAVLLTAAMPIAHAFTADVGLAALIASMLPIAAAILLPDGGQVVIASALRARGDNWFPTASHIVAYFVVMPPAGYVLGESMGRGVSGLMEAILAASILSAGVLLARQSVLMR